MSSVGNFYDILGVSEDASDTDVKKAYRGLSLRHHPDRGGDAEKFKELAEAYDTLSDASKRRQYDIERRMGDGMTGMGGLHNLFQNLFQHGQGNGPEVHVFSMGPGGMPFGPGGGGVNSGIPGFLGHFMRPQSIHIQVALELEQVYTGCTIPVEYERFVIRHDNRRHSERRTMEVSIVAGVQDGEIIVLPEVGNMVGDMAGDVKILVQIAPHAVFQRDKSNLVYVKTLTLRESLCGFGFEIPLLNGRVLTIKNVVAPIRIIYPDMQQVCPGYGLSQGNNHSVGALVIHFKIEFPESLSEEVKSQLSALLP